MQARVFTRAIGGVVGAAIMAVGLVAFTPQTGAAQGPAGQGIGRPGRGAGGAGGAMGRGGRGGPMSIAARDLTDAQREQIKAIHERHAAAIRPAAERMQTARQALAEAVLSGSGNLQALSMEVGAAEGELALANAQVETEVLAVLTPEQRQKIQDRRKEGVRGKG